MMDDAIIHHAGWVLFVWVFAVGTAVTLALAFSSGTIPGRAGA